MTELKVEPDMQGMTATRAHGKAGLGHGHGHGHGYLRMHNGGTRLLDVPILPRLV